MYRIAICDDETEELDKTEQILLAYQKKYPDTDLVTDRFANAKELLEEIRENGYAPDLLLMDIYMPGKPGIDAARELRGMGNGSRIVFLTASKEHALDAFGVDAVQYLVKPVSEELLFPLLDRRLGEAAEERRKYLLLRIDGRIQRVPLNDIAYCEAQRKTQCLFLADGTQHWLHTTMAELYKMLVPWREFVRVGVAYIVNLEYIESLNAQEICLNDGKRIYLPRGAYKTLKEQYFRYYCEPE